MSCLLSFEPELFRKKTALIYVEPMMMMGRDEFFCMFLCENHAF